MPRLGLQPKLTGILFAKIYFKKKNDRLTWDHRA